jgi:serine/threonine protein phosphatase 1
MAIARFLNRLKPIKPYPPLAPREQPLCIIGDIHGRADLLDELVLQICTQGSVQGMRVVLVGDLIDRGPDSAGVLARVRDWCAKPAPFAEVICLMGNHEAMMLDFLAEPTLHGPRWLAHGGDTTLQSFGLSPYQRSEQGTPDARLIGLRDALREMLPSGLEAWLQDLPQLWQEQALVISHAGANPARAISQQTVKSLLWGHPSFHSHQRQDGIWIAHGHVITPEPTAQAGRIAIDTGAWRTGRLTAALLDKNGLRFMDTSAPK